MPPTADQGQVRPDPVAQQPQHLERPAPRSGAPDSPPAPAALDLRRVEAQAVAADRGVGGDDAVQAERERQVGDREHVVVGEVGGDLDQQRHAGRSRVTSSARAAHGAQQRLEPLDRLQVAQARGVRASRR